MTSVMDTQKENVKKVFYAAVGTPMVAGRKFIDFGTDLFTETSLEDLEAAGREVTGAIRDSKVVEQIQESVDLIQDSNVVEQIQVKVDVDQASQLAARYGVSSIPNLIVFKDGDIAARHVGLASKAQLKAMLSQD